MRRRIARLLRGVIEGADESIRMLEIEKNAINPKNLRRSEELAAIDRVLSKLEELALTIEFELHLKQTAADTQTENEPEVGVERLCVKSAAMSTRTPSAFEARVESFFGEAADASTRMPSELDARLDRPREGPVTGSTHTPSVFEARVNSFFEETAEDGDA
jgi:hypothetical protein